MNPPPLQLPDMHTVVGHMDIVFITLDTLRYDVAVRESNAGRTPNITRILPNRAWRLYHSPATFTYAAHHAFFSGFLPTPATQGPHPRLFATRFLGSTTTTPHTFTFDTPTIVEGLSSLKYHTICIGGVGFFNFKTPIGKVLPSLFQEHHWDPTLSVTDPNSTRNQCMLAQQRIRSLSPSQRLFLFINISALHQPNYTYLPNPTSTTDTIESHAAALRYVDSQLPILFQALSERPTPTFLILCSDHGTAYGEDGFHGHRLSHPTVLNVPYIHTTLQPSPSKP